MGNPKSMQGKWQTRNAGSWIPGTSSLDGPDMEFKATIGYPGSVVRPT
jgi:hypothetical protein